MNSSSNLRSLTLDQWSVFVLQTLVEDLGNNRAAEVIFVFSVRVDITLRTYSIFLGIGATENE